MRLRFLLTCAAIGALSVPPAHAQTPTDRLVVLVRHAEKAAEPANDPPLTDAGKARAAALASLLTTAHLGSVIVTPYERTRATGEPAIAASGAARIEIAVAGGLAAHVDAVAAAVRARPAGETVLVVGHSNTIPKIVTALGGPAVPDLCDGEYAALFVLVLPPDGPARLVRASYGAPDPPDAAACRSPP
jgi:broad specificity phosphatase PhoE